MQTEQAARLWGAGRSATQIAADLNAEFKTARTRNAVIGKLDRLCLLGTRAIRVKRQPPKSPSSVADVLTGMVARSAYFGKVYPLPPDEPMPSTAVNLEERLPHQCAWPVNHGGPFLFCGARRSEHRAFCDHHAAVAALKD